MEAKEIWYVFRPLLFFSTPAVQCSATEYVENPVSAPVFELVTSNVSYSESLDEPIWLAKLPLSPTILAE